MDCLSELLQSPTGHLNVLCSYPHNWRHPKFLKVTAYCLLNLDPNLKISIQSVETPQCLNNLYNVLYLPPLQYLQNQFSAMKYAMSVLWLRFQGYLVCLYLLHVTQWPYGKKWPFHQVMEPSIDGRLEDQKDDDTFGGFPEILCQHQYMTTTSFFRMIIRMKT